MSKTFTTRIKVLSLLVHVAGYLGYSYLYLVEIKEVGGTFFTIH
jgi:hypothetical protein